MRVLFNGAGWGLGEGEEEEIFQKVKREDCTWGGRNSRDTVDYHAGGGIVWDSQAEAEWNETEVKSREFGAAMASLAAGEPPRER